MRTSKPSPSSSIYEGNNIDLQWYDRLPILYEMYCPVWSLSTFIKRKGKDEKRVAKRLDNQLGIPANQIKVGEEG